MHWMHWRYPSEATRRVQSGEWSPGFALTGWLTGPDWRFTNGLGRWAVPNSQSPTSMGNRKQEKQNYLLDTRTVLINKCKCFFFFFLSLSLQVVGVSFALVFSWIRWLNKLFIFFQDAKGFRHCSSPFPQHKLEFWFLESTPPRWSRQYL